MIYVKMCMGSLNLKIIYIDNFISFTTLITKLGRVAVYKRLDYGGTERGEDVFSAAGQLH